jgi:hypothetical protein
MENFSKIEREYIESAFLHGDYCGNGALGRANIRALCAEFGNLEGIAFDIEREAYSTEFVKFNWEIFEPAQECIIGGSQGIYIPQIFADKLAQAYIFNEDKDISESLAICAMGPHGNELYWDAWQEVQNAVRGRHFDMSKGSIEQDGDVFYIHEISPEIERLYETLAVLLEYPVIDEETLAKQELEEEEKAVADLAQYPSGLVRALYKLGVPEDDADTLHDMKAETLESAIFRALSLASDEGKDITVHEQKGAYIDEDKLAKYLIDVFNLPHNGGN